jgi:hypothetical protein
MLHQLGLYTTRSPTSIIHAGRTPRSRLTCESSLMPRVQVRSLAKLFVSFRFLSNQSETCAEEVRAIVPLPKGTEVFFPYQPSLEDRAGRREGLERYGFVCNCEMCGLPDDLSDALDKKIKLAKDAQDYLIRFCEQQEHDAIRAIQHVAIFMSITIRERLFFDYTQFYLPLNLLCFFGKTTLLEDVCKAVHQLYQRHLGHKAAEVKILSSYLENALGNISLHKTKEAYLASVGAHRLITRLEETARSIISDIQNIP